jgi:hypothetical protein
MPLDTLFLGRPYHLPSKLKESESEVLEYERQTASPSTLSSYFAPSWSYHFHLLQFLLMPLRIHPRPRPHQHLLALLAPLIVGHGSALNDALCFTVKTISN